MFTKDPPAAVVAHAQHQGEDHFPFAGAQIHAAGGGNKAGATLHLGEVEKRFFAYAPRCASSICI